MITSDYRGAGSYELMVNGVQREVFEANSEQDFKRFQKIYGDKYFGVKKYNKIRNNR